jgi:hypothetical protein
LTSSGPWHVMPQDVIIFGQPEPTAADPPS